MLLLVDDAHRGHVFPATVEAAELLLDEIESLYFYEVDAADNTVAGYGFHGAAKAGATEFASTNLWQLALPEPIVAVSCRRWRGRPGVGGWERTGWALLVLAYRGGHHEGCRHQAQRSLPRCRVVSAMRLASRGASC